MKVLENIYDLNIITEVFLDKMMGNDHKVKIFGFCIDDVKTHLNNLGFADDELEINGWQVDWWLGFTGTDYNLQLSGELWYKNYFTLCVS